MLDSVNKVPEVDVTQMLLDSVSPPREHIIWMCFYIVTMRRHCYRVSLSLLEKGCSRRLCFCEFLFLLRDLGSGVKKEV